MTISHSDYLAMQRRINASRKPVIRENRTTDKDSLKVEPSFEEGREIESLHKPFIVWLDYHQVCYVWSRSDKPTTNKPGQFDFVCAKNGHCLAVEFKAHSEPEKHLSNDQRDWRIWAEMAKVPTLITNNVQEACRVARIALGIDSE